MDAQYTSSLLFSGLTDSLFTTTNGGLSWIREKKGNGQRLKEIFFIDSINGWILGDYSYNLITSNGGLNWDILPTTFGNTKNIFFLNANTGWIFGNPNSIRKTTNSGINWNLQLSGGTCDYIYYADVIDINFKNDQTGWGLVGDGTILKSTNGGINWNRYNNTSYGEIISLDFRSINVGFAISNYLHGTTSCDVNHGYIWKTSDMGVNWEMNYITQSNHYFTSMIFVNYNKGFVCGGNKIYKTNNNGNNWSVDSIGNWSFNSIHFIDEKSGWLCGQNGVIYSSSNGGTNWIQSTTNTNTHLNSIYFLNNNTGFACGDSGKVLHTTNAGSNWNSSVISINNLKQVYFIDNLTGFIIANRSVFVSFIGWFTYRELIRTTNGGVNWIPVINSASVPGEDINFNSVYFPNAVTGWLSF